jgi:hypothetical protein
MNYTMDILDILVGQLEISKYTNLLDQLGFDLPEYLEEENSNKYFH